MYFYIYDQFVQEKKYQSTIAKIENRLTDLEIQGKIGRLNLLNNPDDLVKKAIQNGATTIVAVGDDLTVSKIINILTNFSDVCLGIIPIGRNLKIARTLGINSPIDACNILASRIIKKMDIGRVNDIFFLSQVELTGGHITIKCDDKYSIELQDEHLINIYNFNYWTDDHIANPTDGLLEMVLMKKRRSLNLPFLPNKNNFSLFYNKKIKIKHTDKPIEAKIDDQRIIKTPITVSIAEKQIKVIVGKDRAFI